MRRLSSSASVGVAEWPRLLIAIAWLLIFNVSFLSMSARASAEFVRPFKSVLESAPTGPMKEQVPFEGLQGLAVDPLSNNVFVGDLEGIQDFALEFNPSDTFLRQLTCGPVHSLAFDDASDKLVCAGAEEFVAVDNTTTVKNPTTGTEEPSHTAGDIYFARETGTVSRVNANGEPANFTCDEGGQTPKYIKNGNELVGDPQEIWEGINPVAGVAVDSSSGPSAGDIYVSYSHNPDSRIDVFAPTGCFDREITGPTINEEKSFAGRGPTGLAVDPTDGDILAEAKDIAQKDDEVVYEFSESGKLLGEITGRSKTAQFGVSGLSIDNSYGIVVNSLGELYLTVKENEKHETKEKEVVDEFGPGAYFPGAVTGEVTDASPKTATLSGTVRGTKDSEGHNLEVTKCEFEYVTEGNFKVSGFNTAVAAPCILESGALVVNTRPEEKDYPVHGQAVGLQSGQVYDYRLVVETSTGEHGGTQYGEVASFAAPASPVIEATSVGDVSSTSADFSARIDPTGSETTYQFQYMDATGYQAAVAAGAADPYAAGGSVPIPVGDIGSGDRDVSVSVQTAGLSQGTVYHYRVVASNGVGETDGPDGVFATVPNGLPGLPDGRAYELVTPANKGDAEDMFGHPQVGAPAGSSAEENLDRGYASEDGDHFLLSTRAEFGPFPASGEGAYVFSRSEHGWMFKSVVSSSLGIQSTGDLVFDPTDLSMVGVVDLVGAGNGNEHSVFDLVGPPGGPYATVASSGSGSETGTVNEVGASTDLGLVVVESEDHKLPECENPQEALAETLDPGVDGLYEWAATHQCLSLVDVESESEGGLVSKCGAVLGRGQSGAFPGDMHGAVSGDGSKIFFTAPAPFNENDSPFQGSGCWKGGTADSPQLYMRLNGDTTVEVSAPEPGVEPATTYPAIYVGASEDGSRVFFITRTDLTREASSLGLHDPELYEYNTNTDELGRVSRGTSGETQGEVADVPAISADGSTVYFNAAGNLAPHGENGGLYRYDTTTGATTYIAPEQGYPVISGGNRPRTAWYGNEVNAREVPSLELEAPYYTTRDGQFLLFGPYRYDAADDSTVCVMCNPNGSGPISGAAFTRSALEHDNPEGGPAMGMSENGEYVFFDTAESLVPQDTNGTLDVYEWHGGRISLISSGENPKASFFLDSSSYVNAKGETVEGGNVFFGTHAKLVPEDTDSSGDLYDGRIGGGFGTSSGAGPCEGDACDNPPPAPLAPTPATLTQAGSGNFASESPTIKAPTKCKKGKKLVHGRCVKQKDVKKAKKTTRALKKRGK